jgi:glycosyltransferase involved in cell wall biosynthesis
LYSSPSLIGALAALALSKLLRCRFVFEVRDIWPLTLIKNGGWSAYNPFILVLGLIEKFVIRRCDKLITNFPGGAAYANKFGLPTNRYEFISNGILLQNLEKPQMLPQEFVSCIPKEKFIVGYTGTLGTSNAMSVFFEAANLLKGDPRFCFVVAGTGRLETEHRNFVAANNLENVVFLGTVPKFNIQALLKMFDVCYIGWLKSDFYEYGVAANKIFDYFASAKPIIHSYTGSLDPVELHNAGLSIQAGSADLVVSAIIEIFLLPPEQREALGNNGKMAMLEFYNYEKIGDKLWKVLFEN